MKAMAFGAPRVVAHRGLSGVCPENTLPAFAAAVALGADEIELDVWASRDGELVACNLFFGDGPDTPEEAVRLCGLGLDAILTNWANTVLPAVRRVG